MREDVSTFAEFVIVIVIVIMIIIIIVIVIIIIVIVILIVTVIVIVIVIHANLRLRSVAYECACAFAKTPNHSIQMFSLFRILKFEPDNLVPLSLDALIFKPFNSKLRHLLFCRTSGNPIRLKLSLDAIRCPLGPLSGVPGKLFWRATMMSDDC